MHLCAVQQVHNLSFASDRVGILEPHTHTSTNILNVIACRYIEIYLYVGNVHHLIYLNAFGFEQWCFIYVFRRESMSEENATANMNIFCRYPFWYKSLAITSITFYIICKLGSVNSRTRCQLAVKGNVIYFKQSVCVTVRKIRSHRHPHTEHG